VCSSYLCYYVTNTGLSDFPSHDLTDSELGDILTGFPVVIAPGASAWLTQGATIDETTTNTATWTATDTETDASATGTDSATVVVPVPSISLVKTVGTDAASCAVDVLITVAADTEVTYCYTVTNTGDAPLTMHDLSDSELGDVLTDFPEMLEPAASFFVTASATIGVDTTNTATWTARDPELGLLAAASADATVEIALEPTTTTTTTTTTTGAAVTPTSTAPGGEVAANVAERGSSSLPVTGSDLGVLAWLGLALLVLGGAALGLSRRRA
jgi:LPXTG-motif cell wall-anchored protein